MGKKSSRRKTRWRTLSIGAPPGEEDEEDGLRNGYVKSKDNESSTQGFETNGQSGDYKSRKSSGSGYSSGYASAASRSRNKDAEDSSTGSPSQQNKIIFNEDEYTRITTPRQDVLFKKGYLSRKKAWPGNASTSATPSTTESQSASHSTADGSEMNEDQQLLDSGSTECPSGMEPQLGYSTFYDHASGYCYEYPVMLVGPAPISAQVGPSVLAAVPCGSVPLRPIEWINPAFVPKLSDQSYCVMNYRQDAQTSNEPPPPPPPPSSHSLTGEQNNIAAPLTETPNGTWNGESGTGSASCSGSVAEEAEEQCTEEGEEASKNTAGVVITTTTTIANVDETLNDEYLDVEMQHLEEGEIMANGGGSGGAPYIEPMIMHQQPPMHVPHVIHAVPQPYMYPGHYMFGPPLINVNGFTVQGVPMIRSTEVTSSAAIYAKRRKKKKRRKQRRLASGNLEDDEEYYSSGGESARSSSHLGWSTATSTAPMVMDASSVTATTSKTSNRPLNPECQEFHLRPIVELEHSDTPGVGSSTTSTIIGTITTSDQVSCDRPSLEEVTDNLTSVKTNESQEPDQPNDQQLSLEQQGDTSNQQITEELVGATVRTEKNEAQRLTNGEASYSDKDNNERNDKVTTKTPGKKKYLPKGQKFTREATPGPEIVSNEEGDARSDSLGEEPLEKIEIGQDVDEGSNEDSGFETQTHHGSGGYRITEAVTAWLRTVNSPDIFIAPTIVHTDSEEEEEEEMETSTDEDEPAKNLQGNPTLALSANGGIGDGLASSRAATCGEFAKATNDDDETVVEEEEKCKIEMKYHDGKQTKKRFSLDSKSDSSSDSPPPNNNNNNESSGRSTVNRKRNTTRNEIVAGVCEFTAKDSVAGVRVALSSRINSKRSRFVKTGLKTYEKGEIVVSANGKLMAAVDEEFAKTSSSSLSSSSIKSNEEHRRFDEQRENLASLGIEEADVLECWEAETVEPIRTPRRRLMQSRGTACDGEATEDDRHQTIVVSTKDVAATILKHHVQRYYRLGELEYATSVEEETPIMEEEEEEEEEEYTTVPNNSVEVLRGLHGEEISIITPNDKDSEILEQQQKWRRYHHHQSIPIDEAFEAYESCSSSSSSYIGKTRNFLNLQPKLAKARIFYTGAQNGGEHPVPCRAVCCSIQ